MTRHPATQKDVAAALGIAQRTVSRAFAAPATVRTELRERIVSTATRLGYRSHAGARTMRTGRCEQVLLVQGPITTTSNLPDGTLSGLLDGLAQHGVHLGIVRFDDEQLNKPDVLPTAIRDLRSDGLLINYTSNIPERLAHHIARHRIPVIWINSRQPEDCAHPDDLGAGRMLTEHLLSLGHRRIAWVDLFVEHTALCHYSRHDRRAGYRQAMDAAGLPIRECTPAHEIPGSQCASVAAGLVSGRDRATAIACYSTIEASAVMRAATLAGLRLPEDLSIAVVDDHPAFLGVPMTTALLDLPALGRTAAELLMQRIAHPRQHVPPAAIPSLLVTGLSTTTCAP